MAKSDLNKRREEIEGLVKVVKEGGPDAQEAFSVLYDIFVDPLYRYVYYRVNPSDAEDLLEVVFLKVWENIDKYTSGKSSFSAWIFRITHNVVVDYYRAKKNTDTQELSMQIPDNKREHNPIKSTKTILNNEILKAALKNLKKSHRDIVIYKFLNELTNKEIATILKKSEGSIRILQFRALKALKKELKGMGIDYEF